MLAQHLIKVYLRMADGTVNHTAVVVPFAGFAVASEVNAHQPPVPSAPHDLPGFSGQNQPPSRKIWHTTGTPAPIVALSIQ